MPPKIFYSSVTVLVLMFFKLNSLSAFIFYLTVANLKQVLEFVKFSVSPKIFYSSVTVLVLMFFKLNSLSAVIFYFYSSNLETRLLEFVKFSVPLKNVLLQCHCFSSDVFQIKQSLCCYFLFLQ